MHDSLKHGVSRPGSERPPQLFRLHKLVADLLVVICDKELHLGKGGNMRLSYPLT